MLYMFFITALIVSSLKVTNKVGFITCIGLGFAVLLFFLLPMITKILFYDTLPYWLITQSIANVILIALLIKELIREKGKEAVSWNL